MHKQGECLDTISILNEQIADASLCHVAPYRDEKKGNNYSIASSYNSILFS